jgi:hypothetical protein
MFSVMLKLEDGSYDSIIVKNNHLQNVVTVLTNNQWVKCDETEKYYNMNKVINFDVTEVDK